MSVITPANVRTRIYESATIGRPKELGNTGYNVSDDTQKLLAGVHASGMDPHVLAEWLKKGIEDELFLVVPYENGPRMVELALERFQYYASVEGMKAWEARQTAGMTEEEFALHCEREGMDFKSAAASRGASSVFTSNDVGFGKARGDLDWVSEAKRFRK